MHSTASAVECTSFFESLILAQDERWRCALGMQVERDPVFGLVTVADG
jgi:hypothetical protein